jgi:hypothetical protein
MQALRYIEVAKQELVMMQHKYADQEAKLQMEQARRQQEQLLARARERAEKARREEAARRWVWEGP